ncbi:MAG: hypothetical protein KIT00_11185 [Rhodospirillales bacterium]|nr:hypothetical protein [Rhodospirillales bacterium]
MSTSMSASAQAALRQSLPVSCFSVVASAEPDVMPRVLEVFAKRGLVPSQWYSSVSGPRGRDLHIDVQIGDLDVPSRERIANSLRQIVYVELVLTSEKRLSQSA